MGDGDSVHKDFATVALRSYFRATQVLALPCVRDRSFRFLLGHHGHPCDRLPMPPDPTSMGRVCTRYLHQFLALLCDRHKFQCPHGFCHPYPSYTGCLAPSLGFNSEGIDPWNSPLGFSVGVYHHQKKR